MSKKRLNNLAKRLSTFLRVLVGSPPDENLDTGGKIFARLVPTLGTFPLRKTLL